MINTERRLGARLPRLSRRQIQLHPSRRLLLLVSVTAGILFAACGAHNTGVLNHRHAATVTIIATPQGCRPAPAKVHAGEVVFAVSNLDAPTVSEIEIRTSNFADVLGEKENLIEGLSARFSAVLGSGHYVVNCPGADKAHWPFVVFGGSH